MGGLVSAIQDTDTVAQAALALALLQIQLTLAVDFMMSAIFIIEIEALEGIVMIYSSNA